VNPTYRDAIVFGVLIMILISNQPGCWAQRSGEGVKKMTND